MPGRYLADAAEERRVAQYELEREIVAHRIVVRRRLDVRVPEQRLDLGGEHHTPVVGTVVQRLDAEVIACGNEAPRFRSYNTNANIPLSARMESKPCSSYMARMTSVSDVVWNCRPRRFSSSRSST